MGMYCYMLRVPEPIAKKIGKNHGLWDSVRWQASEACDVLAYERELASMSETDRAQAIARREAKMTGELGRMIRAAMARNESKHARAKGLVPAPAFSLQKAWNIIENAIMNAGYEEALLHGANAGKDLGYGPPMLRNPAQTAAFASFLNRHSAEELISRMNPNETARFIYTPDDDSARIFAETLNELYPPLQTYVSQAAQDGDALLVWIT